MSQYNLMRRFRVDILPGRFPSKDAPRIFDLCFCLVGFTKTLNLSGNSGGLLHRPSGSLTLPTMTDEHKLDPMPGPQLDAIIARARECYNRANAFQSNRDDALYRMCYHASFCLPLVHDPAFEHLCRERNAKGDFPETRIIDLITQTKDGKSTLNAERRADYAAAACWVRYHYHRNQGAIREEDAAVDEIRKLRGIRAIATAYREWATENCERGSFGVTTLQAKKAAATRAARQSAGKAADHAPEVIIGNSDGEAEHGTMHRMPIDPVGEPVGQGRNCSSTGASMNWFEPIVIGPPPVKHHLSDEKKVKGREFVEKAFHARNSVSDTVGFVRAYHRVIGDWSPSDLDIGSFTDQVAKLKEQNDDSTSMISQYKTRCQELEEQLADMQAENKNLRKKIRTLEHAVRTKRARVSA